MKRLRAHVHVAGKVYGPGDEVPAKHAKLIGAHAWEDAGQAPADEDSGRGPDEGAGMDVPPRSGRGSGVEAWRAFAEQNGVDTDDEMSRDNVIAAVEAAGVIASEQPEE